MSKKAKKTTEKSDYQSAVDFIQFRLDSMQLEFKNKSNDLVWQLTQGGGIHNIHIQGSLRDLLWLYTDIATHIDALRSLKYPVDGIDGVGGRQK